MAGRSALLEVLERDGILLIHDRRLPSASSIIAGGPVAGSWWAHPLANDIYDGLQPLDRVAIRVKLVAQKETFVHRRLWPELLCLAQSGAGWQVNGLSDPATQLFAAVRRARAPKPASELHPSLDAKARQRAVREIQVRLLVHAQSVHTSTGAHAKYLRSWPSFAREHAVERSRDLEHARSAFESATRTWPDPTNVFPWQRV
jgi:hypothetical protein